MDISAQFLLNASADCKNLSIKTHENGLQKTAQKPAA